MRAVVQRVIHSTVDSNSNNPNNRPSTQAINKGLLVFLGITHEDGLADVEYIVNKLVHLRIFEDDNQKMNCSVQDCGGEIMLISQFTLYGDARKGRRPSFSKAAPPELAVPLYNECINRLKALGLTVKTGIFGADMKVYLINDGPVTILLDSKKEF